MKIILASTSPYRRNILNRLGYAFEAVKPDADEESIKILGLSPKETAIRCAELKAKSLQAHFHNCLIIGADQTGEFQGERLGKPLTRMKAKEQLLQLQSRTHYLHSAVHLLWAKDRAESKSFVVTTELKMRRLSNAQIESYLNLENPIDCCGSYKFESQGIKLFESITNGDDSTIQGLPLMELQTQLLTFQGLELFS